MSLGLAPLARWLEADRARSPALLALASLWGAASAARIRRRVAIPRVAQVIGIGGPTLGGSGKTPLAIALARAIAARGEKVALVGHAYRARPGSARVVAPTDAVADVGDDALFAARSLAPFGIDVVVAPARQAAIDHAASRAPWLIVDGLLQTEPARLARSVLVVDERFPWGNGRCPPAGDLRAPREALQAAADAIVRVIDSDPLDGVALGARCARVHLDRVTDPGGAATTLHDLRGSTLGIISAIARPDRVLRSLARRGLRPDVTVELADHARPPARALERAASRKQRVNAWLATAKCALNLPPQVAGAPVLALDFRLELPKELVDWVLSTSPLPQVLCPSSPGQNPW